MSFRNVYYDKRKNKIHLWHTVKDERFYDVIDWVPYVWLKTTEANATATSPNNIPVEKKLFKSSYDYKEFCERNKTNIFENHLREEIQFLVDRYYKIKDDELEVPKLKVLTFDAEMVKEGGGFPSQFDGKDPITCICVHNSFTNEYHMWGVKPYTGENKNLIFHYCLSTELVMKGFLKYVHKEAPDVLTGWNIIGFDLVYFYNFCINRLSKDDFDLLSPIGITSIWERNGTINIDIAGVTILDYLPLFKAYYAKTRLSNFKLDTVAKHVLSEGKLDYSQEYTSLNDLFEQNWDLYCDYCTIDVKRVVEIQEKCKFIELILSLSLLSKCPMKFYEQITAIIEGTFLTYYRRQGKCAQTFIGGIKETFPAALVKEPSPGFEEWLVDFDITSSYPFSMIALNMGTNTYIGKIKTKEFDINRPNFWEYETSHEEFILTEYDVISCNKAQKYPIFILETQNGSKKIDGEMLTRFNQKVKNKEICIAPNGAIFNNLIPGDIASLEKELFLKRKELDQKKLQLEKDGADEALIQQAAAIQVAVKRILNSIYGAISVPFSRLYNIEIAKAITATGRMNLIHGHIYVNEFLNNPEQNKELCELIQYNNKSLQDIDFIKYCDTDSLFIKVYTFIYTFGNLEYFDSLCDEKKIDLIQKISKCFSKYVNERCFSDLQQKCYNSVETEFKINFKQEIVAKSGIFIAKKKYVTWIVNEKGIPKDEIFARGLELIRSDTPEAIKPRLNEVVEKILKKEKDKNLRNIINQYEKELLALRPEELAANIGCSEIAKYTLVGYKAKKGTPMHIKGAINYRFLLNELGLKNKYEDLIEGTKAKVVYLLPNKYELESLSFNRWPIEFLDVGIKMDYSKMLNKYFFKKIDMFLSVIGKSNLLNKNEELISAFF